MFWKNTLRNKNIFHYTKLAFVTQKNKMKMADENSIVLNKKKAVHKNIIVLRINTIVGVRNEDKLSFHTTSLMHDRCDQSKGRINNTYVISIEIRNVFGEVL